MSKKKATGTGALRQRIGKLELARDKHYKLLQEQNGALHKWAATVMPMVELGLQSTALMSLLLKKEIITEDEIQETLKELQDNARKIMDEENATAETQEDSGKGDPEEADSSAGE
jgi:hypothetical protein